MGTQDMVTRPEMPVPTPEAPPVSVDRPRLTKDGNAPTSIPTAVRRDKSGSSGLRAGFADDNKQFNYYLSFLEKYKSSVNHYPLNINERIHFIVQDAAGKPICNADVAVYAGNKLLTSGKTYADGSFFFFPSLYDPQLNEFSIRYTYQQHTVEKIFSRNDKRLQPLRTDRNRTPWQEIPLDILFILDTTGSMGEEINRLKTTIDLIHLNLTSLKPQARVRFGMVLFRDKQDEYTTKVIPLTEDVALFQKELQQVSADGGGDTPEDLQTALKVAIEEIDWNPHGIRLGFIITDAPPHLDYGQTYTYLDAARDAKKQGIKLFSVGTGGLDLMGEYILRQISQFTYAKYIFLTYGEKGESDGGKPGSVSHHTGSNYQTDKLEAIIIQLAKEELAQQMDKPLEEPEDYFTAKVGNEKKDETLTELFKQAISQLQDYSSIKIDPKNVLAVLSLTTKETMLEANAEYLTEMMTLATKTFKTFTLAERVDLQKIAHELGVQQSGLVADSLTVKMGAFLGAQLLLTGNLYEKMNDYEVFLKLLWVETGELLSITRLKIDRRLAL